MHDLLLIVFLLVTWIARCIARCLEKVIRLGRMRIVAEGAFPLLECGVDIGLVQSDLFPAVTGIADLISFLLKDELGTSPCRRWHSSHFFSLTGRWMFFKRRV